MLSDYTNATNTTLRLMQSADLSSVWKIQCDCYQQLLEPESALSLEAKRQASPISCFVVMVDDVIGGKITYMYQDG